MTSFGKNLAVIEIKITSNQCLKSVQPADLPSVFSAVTAPTSAFALKTAFFDGDFCPSPRRSAITTAAGTERGVAHAQKEARFQL